MWIRLLQTVVIWVHPFSTAHLNTPTFNRYFQYTLTCFLETINLCTSAPNLEFIYPYLKPLKIGCSRVDLWDTFTWVLWFWLFFSSGSGIGTVPSIRLPEPVYVMVADG